MKKQTNKPTIERLEWDINELKSVVFDQIAPPDKDISEWRYVAFVNLWSDHPDKKYRGEGKTQFEALLNAIAASKPKQQKGQ